MSYEYKIKRRLTKKIKVGSVEVGGDSPITVQTMTNTPTEDHVATINQINKVVEAGADIVRVSCPDKKSLEGFAKIVKAVDVPIVVDIHFLYKLGIEAVKLGASCLRINPGNIGPKEAVKELVKVCKDYNTPIRIGVNAGSLEKQFLDKYGEPTAEALVESALYHAKLLEDEDFYNFKISVKASNVFLAIDAYEKLSKAVDYPLHIGITEAGPFTTGTVKSSMGLGYLLYKGIGDTIRVSLSSDPVDEVKVGYEILKSLAISNKGVKIISCPSCSRQGFDVVSKVTEIENRLSHIKEPVTLSILGCIVNGIGEAAHSDIGIVGVKNQENMVYLNGKKDHTVSDEHLLDHLVELVEDRAKLLRKDEK